jgi:formylglycine-generating enzyme required for sulfatase activity
MMLVALIAGAGAMTGVGPGVYAPLFAKSADDSVQVENFELDRLPVTNADFLAFVRTHPSWRRSQVPRAQAEEQYLGRWAGDLELGPNAAPHAPVVQVSWFAAQAFCEARGARLPTEAEWELAGAADETHRDARQDSAFTKKLLAWYEKPNPERLPDVGRGAANAWGVNDLHGLVWEWVGDFMSGAPVDGARFCGPGAAAAANKSDYAAFMRTAFRSSLEAKYTVGNLGFRCARTPGAAPAAPAVFTSHGGEKVPLAQLTHGPAVASMFFGSCSSVCPLLFEKLKRVEKRLSPRARERLTFSLVTFDPDNDTPERLADLATAHGLDGKHWRLLSGPAEATRTVAALLGIRYRFIADGMVSHSSAFVVFDAKGNIAERLDGLEGSEDALVEAIERVTAP